MNDLDYWSLDGNTGTVPGTGVGQNYLGTSDAVDFVIATDATQRVGISATGDLTVAGTAGTPNVTLSSLGGVAKAAVPAGFDRMVISNATGDVDAVEGGPFIGQFAWLLEGNVGTNPANNYVGTGDAQPLVFRTIATETARFLTSGEFGIGTATPGQLLEVEDGNVLLGTSAAGTAGALQFQEDGANGNDVVSFQAPSALAATTTYTLPSVFPATDGEVLASTTGGVMSWTDLNDLDYWSLDGNTGTVPGIGVGQNYLGTGDAVDFVIATDATQRVSISATGDLTVAGTAGTPNVTLSSLGGVAKAAVPAGYDRMVLSNATGDIDAVEGGPFIGQFAWLLEGNTGANPANNYVGTGDAQPLVFRTFATETARFLTSG